MASDEVMALLARAAALLESKGYKVMAFCGLGDYKGTSGKKKIFPKAPPG